MSGNRTDPRSLNKQALDSLMMYAQLLNDEFLRNGLNEAGRTYLKIQVENTGKYIKSSLSRLIGQNALKSAIETPNSNYNNFISAWNSGAGNLMISFNRETAFWNSLQTAKNVLDPLIARQPVLAPERAGQWGTAPERGLLTELRSQTNTLYDVFEAACVRNQTGDPEMRTKIKDCVSRIGGILNNSSLGQDARQQLTNSKTTWAEFNTVYKNGQGIGFPALSALTNFKTQADMVCVRLLK